MNEIGASTVLYLGVLAGVLQLVGYLVYLRHDDIEPNPATWLMFAYGTALLTFLEWDREASFAELLLPLVCSAMALVVAARCWTRARRRDPSRIWPKEWWPEDWRDRFAFQTDIALTVLYLGASVLASSSWIGPGARDASVTVFLIAANLTAFTAFFPLIRGVLEDPSLERTTPWAIWATAYSILGVTTLATQGTFWSPLMLYPALNAVLHGSVAVLSRSSRRTRAATASASASDTVAAQAQAVATLVGKPGPSHEQDVLRLSRRLVGLHAGAVVTLILVVLGTALWISREHNKLALESSQRLIRNEIEALRSSTYTLVRDYSLWNEGLRAVVEDDRDWLFSSIGSSVTDLDTFDLAILVPHGRSNFGWIAGSPPEGEVDILPPDLLDAIIALLDTSDVASTRTRTLIAEFQGAPWIFAVARMRLVEGVPPGIERAELPIQIHGKRLTEEVPNLMGQDLLETAIVLADTVPPGKASFALVDYTGHSISYVVWEAPRPGASILRQAAIPLALALGFATAISAVSSVYTVRSARRLERALIAARAADRSRTEFLSNVSHELRTPMNGVLGAAQLLETTELDTEQRDLVALLMSSAAAQMSLISDLIDVSRIDSGNRKLEDAPFSPASVLGEVTDMMKVAASRKGIRLDTTCLGLDGLCVRGDQQAFRQILTNLVGNAVKFTDEGGVDVMAAAMQRDDQAQLTIRVVDTGPGIPEAALPHIFERFYQVDGSMSRRTEGTGLGLAISQKLALAMGAKIEVASEFGSGTSFVFTVLADQAEEPPEVCDAA